MTVSAGGRLPAVFDRYRSDGYALFDLEQLDGAGLPAAAGGTHYDEMLDASGAIRPAWDELVAGYGLRGDARLRAAAASLATAASDEGVIYNAVVDEQTVPRPWQIDAVPLIVDGVEWAGLEKAIIQRSMLLDRILRDIYGDQRLISTGLIPPEMVFAHPGYIRKAARLEVAGPHALFQHAVDVGRLPDGRFVAYADRAQAPSGMGFAIIDRRLVSRSFPQLFQACAPRPMATFAGTLRLALFDYAPPGVDDPTVAVLSPGSMSETAFDQAYLAAVLGFPLVEGADLIVRDGTLYMRSLGKFKRVDVLLRRVDAAYTDPLDLRTDSRLGVAGLVEAISRGTVTVLNTLGSGVLQNPALHTVLDRVAPVLLDEELALPSVPTLWGGEELQLSKIVADLDTLVLTNIRTGEEIIGPALDAARAETTRARVRAHGGEWAARRVECYSVAPTLTPGRTGGRAPGTLRAAPVSIRAFSVAQGPTYAVMPGGLGAVLADGIDGAAMHTVAAKDVWVTNSDVGGHVSRRSESRVEPADEVIAIGGDPQAVSQYFDAVAATSPRVLADMFWFGRYGERTEMVTRLTKVARERYQDFQYRPWMNGTAAVPLLLHGVATVTGTAEHLHTADLLVDDLTRQPAPEQVDDAIEKITALTIDAEVPGTVAHAVDHVIAAARAVRDQMSTSTWMVLTPMERSLQTLSRQVSRAGGPGTQGGGPGDAALDLTPDLARTHEEILHGALGLSGLQAESMVHDAAWLLMDLGRRIERTITLADLAAALFAAEQSAAVEQGLMESFLIANESAVIYRRRSRGLYQLMSVVQLVFFDESNPRAMIYQLDRMRQDLVALPEPLRSASAERTLEDMTAALRRSDPADLVALDDGQRSDLFELMTGLREGARELSETMNRTRFAPPPPAQPIWGFGGGDS
ncbi:circularly permuted type 2 ATP-grasp protein [Gordonia sp. NB41Y]|uniref:circularly permuted type 2 ATP-grasp protein n=1 Tax=Gordonia sp. NB41Y TaxID=875808 RepID=UPI00273AEF05|nr:circularly permuted type 2 ATP-grasp protein [Gordonia sp. NB41Y]WLP91024.1 circularly permuted type 2 ATP-grasp protein [Gordonia sp. NB41Y]